MSYKFYLTSKNIVCSTHTRAHTHTRACAPSHSVIFINFGSKFFEDFIKDFRS